MNWQSGHRATFNNGSLGFVELEMKAAGLLEFGTDLENPGFAKLAEAAGLFGLRAENPEEVRPIIEQALTHDGPALVDVVVNRQELAMPQRLMFPRRLVSVFTC
jgi:pyruvate dehydrogenase (quinone)